MKKHILIIFLVFNCFIGFSQLDEYSVMGIPTGTTSEINNVTPLEQGALVYNTEAKYLMVYDGDNWVELTSSTYSLVKTATPLSGLSGRVIAKHSAGGVDNEIEESITTFSQDDTSTTGEITYVNENGVKNKAQVVAEETDNQIKVGANGGAYLGPTVYTGSFIISSEGVTTVNDIPFEPSQVTFVANANVESLNLDSDNGTGNNDRGIDNSFGTMNGFARNIDGTLTQQVIFGGGHGNSINDISRYASSSNCIGVRYGDQNGNSLGKIEGAFGGFTTDGFTINVNYTNGVINVNSSNSLVDVKPTDVNSEALLVLYTAYK